MGSSDGAEVNGMGSQHDRLVSILRDVLEIRGESVRSVALRAGIPVRSLQGVFEGKTPSIDRAAQICAALGLQFYIGPPRGQALDELGHAVMRYQDDYTEELDRGAKDAIVHRQRHDAAARAFNRLSRYESEASSEPEQHAPPAAHVPEAVQAPAEADSADALSVSAEAPSASADDEAGSDSEEPR